MRLTTLFLTCCFACAFSVSANAECQDIRTTQAIVNYVCDYSLVSNTQCAVWREDVRQMHSNTEVIVDSFISWNRNETSNIKAKTTDH